GGDEVVLGSNDRQTAAQAAIEGHATLVMLAFLAEQMSGRQIDPLALPNPAMQLGSSMQAQNSQFPVFRRAPAIIRETMIFPYVSGAGFVHTVWTARGAPTFTDLIPTSTEQVLHPQERYVEAVDEPTTLALAVPEGWQPVYGNVLGEYETRIWLREHLGVSASRASQGWDGDAFHLLASAQGDTVLVWWSVWDDEEAARRFADAAARVPANGGAMQVRRATVGGMPAVSVTRRVSGAEVPPELPPRIVEYVRASHSVHGRGGRDRNGQSQDCLPLVRTGAYLAASKEPHLISLDLALPPDGCRVCIDAGLLEVVASHILEVVPAAHYGIVADSNVADTYAWPLATALREEDVRADVVSFPAGEAHKSRETWAELTDALLARRLGRDGCIIALGGGVACDLGGFV